MTFDPVSLRNLLLVLSAWAVAFLVALWISLIIWAYRDIRARTNDSCLRILAVMLVVLLFIPGVVVYLILRPARTMDDEYQQTLEEEALLQAAKVRLS